MSTTPIDERLGLPSASSALQNSLCYGRWSLQQAWAEITSEPLVDDEDKSPDEEEDERDSDVADIDRDAAAGRRIHAIYAGQMVDGASQAEIDRAEQALAVDRKMRDRWSELFNGMDEQPVMEIRERRWWMHDAAGKKVYSGQTDAVWIRGGIGGPCDILLADLKGLWGYHDTARLNMQIRHYLALVALNIGEFGFTEVKSAVAYLNQPAKTMDPAPVNYEPEDILLAIEQMRADVAAIVDPTAKRTPGPVQCHRCTAKMICEEYQSAQETLIKSVPVPLALPKNDLIARIRSLGPERLAQFCDWAPVLENAAKAAKAEAKRRLTIDPKSVPGYALKENAPRHYITDMKRVWNRMSVRFAITADEFLALCSVSKKNITDTVRAKTGLKGRKLDETCNEVFENATTPTAVSPSLEKLT